MRVPDPAYPLPTMNDPLRDAIPSGLLATPKEAVLFLGIICAESDPAAELGPLLAALTTVAIEAEMKVDNGQQFVRTVRDRWKGINEKATEANREKMGEELGRAISEELARTIPAGTELGPLLDRAYPDYQAIMDTYTARDRL